jgi:hypothetical protein
MHNRDGIIAIIVNGRNGNATALTRSLQLLDCRIDNGIRATRAHGDLINGVESAHK